MAHVESKANLYRVVGASSAGTLIEWYDFYIFGSLATTIAEVFFPKGAGAAALLSTLATFAIGFFVRPFGAIVFGYLGDKIGRKYTFMLTLLLMGGATFAIGIMPGFETIGWAAPILLIVLRLAQGLALGGEYGGAATYVAEHCPDGQRGYWTSWIQTTATLGLFLSLGVILVCRLALSKEAFAEWGWRVPFWISLVLVVFSYYIRRRMQESPLFKRMKASGKGAKNPLKESFGNRANLKLVLLALFGATAGQGVVWYTGQFYAMNFMKLTLGIEAQQTEYIVAIALIGATPFFIVFGALSDRIGRKSIILTGCLVAAICFHPIYSAMSAVADVNNPARFVPNANGVVRDPVEKVTIVPPDPVTGSAGAMRSVTEDRTTFTDGTVRTVTRTTTTFAQRELSPVVAEKQSIVFASLASKPALTLIGLIWIQVIFVTMVYGPIAAFLVELFPTRIRYTSMSLPYHIGNGVFGGMVPFLGQLLVLNTGNKFAGLWYPIAIAGVTVVVGVLFVRENRAVKMWDEESDSSIENV